MRGRYVKYLMSYLDYVKKPSPTVICVGKNYIKHVKEMGDKEIPEVPLLFLKHWSSVNYAPKALPLPMSVNHQVHHELELGVFISKPGSNIPKEKAMEHVGSYFLGIDFTDRDAQGEERKQGFPWTLSKGQKNFCPLSDPIDKDIDPYNIELELKVNGKVRQKDMTSVMHFKIDDIISYASTCFELAEGDLILTGTPDGVGRVVPGDVVEGRATYGEKVLAELNFEVTE